MLKEVKYLLWDPVNSTRNKDLKAKRHQSEANLISLMPWPLCLLFVKFLDYLCVSSLYTGYQRVSFKVRVDFAIDFQTIVRALESYEQRHRTRGKEDRGIEKALRLKIEYHKVLPRKRFGMEYRKVVS